MIQQRDYSTSVYALDGYCASACSMIWLAGYATHAIADINSKLGFHSPANEDGSDCGANAKENVETKDDGKHFDCFLFIASYLMKWGFTEQQAFALITAAPAKGMHWGTAKWAQTLGFRPQAIPYYPGAETNCAAHLCIAVPGYGMPPAYASRPPAYAPPPPRRRVARPRYYPRYYARPAYNPVVPFIAGALIGAAILSHRHR